VLHVARVVDAGPHNRGIPADFTYGGPVEQAAGRVTRCMS
jgi:hypothetical protein